MAPVPVQQLRSLYQKDIARQLTLTAFVHEGRLLSGPCLPGLCWLVEVVGDFEVNVALGLAHTEPGLSLSDMTVAGQGSLHSVL